ncbi:MAG: aldehyde dehydrogenase family protein, partial [Pseudomonadales bacterium]
MTIELTVKNYIDGKWCDGSKGQLTKVMNPSNGELLGEMARGTADDARRAIKAADDAFASWGRTTGTERGDYLDKMADAIERRHDRLVEITKLNSGKPHHEAILDIQNAVEYFRYYAQAARDLDERQNTPVSYNKDRGAIQSVTRFEPMGVVALILPWNFPFSICSWKMAPALAAGNTVVVKPASITPFSETEYGKMADEIGLPPGVINIVNGPGGEIGDELSKNPAVRKVSFTGSNPVGASIMKTAAEDSRNVALELGGKSPIV